MPTPIRATTRYPPMMGLSPGIFYTVEVARQHCGGSFTLNEAFAILEEKRDEADRAALEARIFCESSGGGGFRKDAVYACERQGRQLNGHWYSTFGEWPAPVSASSPLGPRSRQSSIAE